MPGRAGFGVMRDLLAALASWMAPGEARLGEVAIRAEKSGFVLCHLDDRGEPRLEVFHRPEDARHLALHDASGDYRPLKTAPTLRRGWELRLADLAALRRALDYFYPAMLGLLLDFREGTVAPVPLRATLGRQTGMYAVTRRLTDPQAQELIGGFCRTDGGCLKKILWPIEPGQPVDSLPAEKFDPAQVAPGEWPLLCHEACNLLVAKAREVVKASAR
jgi:sirohydrochlorin cobaltochelatase